MGARPCDVLFAGRARRADVFQHDLSDHALAERTPLTNRANSLAEILRPAQGEPDLPAKRPDAGHCRQATTPPGRASDGASRRRISARYNAAPSAAPASHPQSPIFGITA